MGRAFGSLFPPCFRLLPLRLQTWWLKFADPVLKPNERLLLIVDGLTIMGNSRRSYRDVECLIGLRCVSARAGREYGNGARNVAMFNLR